MKGFAWVVFLAWATSLYCGVRVASRSSLLCTTVRGLPENHLLSSGDLICGSAGASLLYNGLYLKHGLTKDSPLTPDDVSENPELRLAPDSTVFMVDVRTEEARKLDAGQKLDLGTNSTPIAKQSRVIALFCPSKASEKCQVGFEVQQSVLKQLTDAVGPIVLIHS